jgi:hypothetical protein
MSYLRYVCLRIVVSNTYCVVFLFCFSSSYVVKIFYLYRRGTGEGYQCSYLKPELLSMYPGGG